MTWTYPAAYWGLRRPGGPGGPPGLGLLGRTPEFPDAALHELEQLRQKFEWSPSATPLGPCHALWPAPGGVLAVRLLDDGPDDKGRGHTLRVEAAWVSPAPADPAALAGLVAAGAWPSPWDQTAGVRPIELRAADPAPGVVGAILGHAGTAGTPPRLLMAAHDSYRAAGAFDAVVTRDGTATPGPRPPDSPPPDSSRPAGKWADTGMASASIPKTRTRVFGTAVAVLLAATAGGAGGYFLRGGTADRGEILGQGKSGASRKTGESGAAAGPAAAGPESRAGSEEEVRKLGRLLGDCRPLLKTLRKVFDAIEPAGDPRAKDLRDLLERIDAAVNQTPSAQAGTAGVKVITQPAPPHQETPPPGRKGSAQDQR